VKRKVLVDLLSYTGNKGGTDVYIKKLYESIGKLKHNYSFFALVPKEAKALDMTWFPGEIKYSAVSGNKKVSWSIGEIFFVNQFAKEIEPDFIHCPANFGPLKSKYKIVLTLHDALYWSKPYLAPNRILLFGVRLMQKFVSRISVELITDSIASSKEIEKYLNIPRDKISPIYLGTDFDGVVNSASEVAQSYFLAGGNRFRHKNWENLLVAWSIISPQQRPSLVITGGGPKDPLEALVEKYSLASHVKLLSWVSEEELGKLYAEATAIVIPSLSEGFSLGVMQALSARKPLLASNIPVHIELAEGIAYFFDPSSPSSIASAVNEFSQEHVGLETRLSLGVERSLSFSWKNCALETLAVFDRV
jgi:alpha-1,3-rhamnosyl/mannosyltransferase